MQVQVGNLLNYDEAMIKLELTDKEYSILVNALEDYKDNMLDLEEWRPKEQKPFFKDQAEKAEALLEKVKNS